MIGDWHFGRSWVGHPLEDECPCEKAPCGLVAQIREGCEQHDPMFTKTIRQSHPADQCEEFQS